MTDGELKRAFDKLKREDLENIISTLNKDNYISYLVKKEIDKLIKPENVSQRFISSALEAINCIQKETKRLEKEISRYSFGINFQNNTIRDFVSLLTQTFEKFVPLFIEQKKYKEGVRFICAIITIVHTSPSRDVRDFSNKIDFSPYYIRMIKSGNLKYEEVLRFRDEFEDRSFITPQDIFNSDKISF